MILPCTRGFWVDPGQRNLSGLAIFLDSFPRQNGSGIAPTGYEYREYKNWRGIPKPRRCPFCKKAKGEIRRKSGGFAGVCPNCDATGPKRGNYDEALRTWNGKGASSKKVIGIG
jgi:hypothetical protein